MVCLSNLDKYKAERILLKSDINQSYYHNVTFKNLKPNSLYAYRVGDGKIWSEYFHFKTASVEEKPFSFIYLGDAQNELKLIGQGFLERHLEKAKSCIFLHAGDLN